IGKPDAIRILQARVIRVETVDTKQILRNDEYFGRLPQFANRRYDKPTRICTSKVDATFRNRLQYLTSEPIQHRRVPTKKFIIRPKRFVNWDVQHIPQTRQRHVCAGAGPNSFE